MAEKISEGWWVVENGNGHREVIYLDRSQTSDTWWACGGEVDVKWLDFESVGYRLIRKINLWADRVATVMPAQPTPTFTITEDDA